MISELGQTKEERINATIRAICLEITRHLKGSAPRLSPRNDPRVQCLDDLQSDDFIEIAAQGNTSTQPPTWGMARCSISFPVVKVHGLAAI